MIGSARFINAGEEPHPTRFFRASQGLTDKAEHIFGAHRIAKHRLEAFLAQCGGDRVLATELLEAATRAVAASKGLVSRALPYREIVVVYGFRIEVIFRIMDGAIRIGSAGLEK